MNDTRKPVEFQHLSDSQAKHYSANIRALLPTYDAQFAVANAYLRTVVPAEAHILVVGAGGGMEIVTFGRLNPGWQFTGVDPSESMITVAKRYAEQDDVADRVEFHHGYVDELAEESSYDAATCMLVLHFLPNDEAKLRLLQAVAARLKPGAPFVVVTAFGQPENPSFRRHGEALYEHVLTTTGHERLAAQLRHNIESSHVVSEPRLLELMQTAGFSRTERFFQTYQIGGWVSFR